MKGFLKLTQVHLKLFLREPAAFFFTLMFPTMLLLLFGAIFGNGNKPIEQFNGYGMVDLLTGGFIGMIIATVGLMSIPVNAAAQREYKILRRLQCSPIRPVIYLASDVFANFITTLGGMILLIIIGKLIYNLRLPGDPFAVIVWFVFSSFSFFALGYLLAAVAPTARMAQVVGNILFFPMLFLSGAAIPHQILPEFLKKVSEFIPLTHVIRIIQGFWFEGKWNDYFLEMGVISGTMLVCLLLAVRLFRWE